MKKCILCGKLSNGSIGAAGIKWSFICQPCKDSEDKALADSIERQRMIFTKLEELCKV